MQSQETGDLIFYDILRFPVTETYLVRDGKSSLAHRGALRLIYKPDIDTFLLNLDSLKFALDKSLQIIKGFCGEEKYPAYLIPTLDGFYMIKILDNKPDIALTNLETVLDSTCVFRTKSGLEEKLDDVREAIIDTKLAVMREVVHMTKDAIVRTLTPHDQHPNYTMFRTFEELKHINTAANPIVDVSPNALEKARIEVDEVVRHHQGNKSFKYFCEFGGTPLNQSMSFSRSTDNDQTNTQKDIPVNFEAERNRSKTVPVEHCDPAKGCDNIDTVKTEHATEAQEVVGTENQRLPVYEVRATKEDVESGLELAVSRLEDAKLYQCEDLPPLETCQIKEDTSVTTDLLKARSPEEERISNKLGGSISNKKEGEANNQSENTKKEVLEYYTGDPYRKDLSATIMEPEIKLEGSEAWGSDVSNPSETPAKLSEAGLSTTSESFNNDTLGGRPLVIQGNLTHSQSLTENPLTASPSKGNVTYKQNNSEKQTMKQKNISDQAIQKENTTAV